MLGEWLLVGLPVAFVIGWFAARLDIAHIRKTARERSASYLRSLRHLLDGRKDKALDIFLNAPEAVSPDVQWTVGALAKQAGEYKHAIAAYRQVYEREDLPPPQRNEALWQLAELYYAMGFMDFAEEHAQSLIHDSLHGQKAMNLILHIYQRRGLHEKALALIEQSGVSDKGEQIGDTAQLLCAHADTLPESESAKKKSLIDRALQINPQCVRALIMSGDWHAANGDLAQAAQHYAGVEHNAPNYLWLVAGKYLDAQAGQNATEQGAETLKRWLDAYPSTMLFERVCNALATHGRETMALIENFLTSHNGTVAAAYWAEKQSAVDPQHTAAWLKVKTALLTAGGQRFVCDNCNYEVNHFSWHCHCCMKWETLKEKK